MRGRDGGETWDSGPSRRDQGKKGGSSDWMEGGVERGDDALKSMLLGKEHSRSRLGGRRVRR